MKRIHRILIFAFVLIGIALKWKGSLIHDREAALNKELTSLEAAESPQLRESLATGGSGPRTMSRSRQKGKAIDPKSFVDGLPKGSNEANEYVDQNRELLAAAPIGILKEICERALAVGNREDWADWDEALEPLQVRIAQTDPAWLIHHVDRIYAMEGRSTLPAGGILTKIGRIRKSMEGNVSYLTKWSGIPLEGPQQAAAIRDYAFAFRDWLDAAESSDRLKGLYAAKHSIACARVDIAIDIGDLAEATRYISTPTGFGLEHLVDDLVGAANTPELERSVLRQAGSSAGSPMFSSIVEELAKKSSVEANLANLAHAELTPERHDLAAAIIVGAKIDDQTPARAAWFLASLQTDRTEPITHLATSWTQGDYKSASQWVNSLPQGRARDAAVAGFASVVVRLEGASAVDWALTIKDPAQRTSTLNSIAQTWKTRDPAAAAAYFQDKGIETE